MAASHNCCRKLENIDESKTNGIKWVKWKRGSILSIFLTKNKESLDGMLIKKILIISKYFMPFCLISEIIHPRYLIFNDASGVEYYVTEGE